MGFCLTVWKLTLIVLFWKNSYTASSFKIESALFLSSGQRRSYEKCSYNEIGVTTFDSWQLEIKKQKLFKLLNMNFYRFGSKGTCKRVRLTEFLNSWTMGFMEFDFSSVRVIDNQLHLWMCKSFSLNLDKLLPNYLKNCIFPHQLWKREKEASSKKM